MHAVISRTLNSGIQNWPIRAVRTAAPRRAQRRTFDGLVRAGSLLDESLGWTGFRCQDDLAHLAPQDP